MRISEINFVTLFALSLLWACGAEEEISIQPESCSPLYSPTYENVYANTLQQTCGQAGGACHALEGGQGGFIIKDIETTYSDLFAEARVQAGAPAESEIVKRMESRDPGLLMPPGTALSPAELCAVETWIANGATRE